MAKKHKFLYTIPSDATDKDYCHKNNVVECAAKVIKKLASYEEIVVVAPMQSGKTEVMKRLVYLVNKHNDKIKSLDVHIDRNNVYVVLCASSVNLKNQHKIKLGEIRNKIYHLNDIQKFLKNTYDHEDILANMADSSLIIFDECHSDAEVNNLIDKFRKLLDRVAKHNRTSYHRVGFSATPYEQIIAGYPKVVMEPGSGYYGISDMFRSCMSKKTCILPTIFQSKDLSDPTECAELFTEIDICKLYYIIRLPGSKEAENRTMDNIERQIKSRGYRLDTYIYDMHYHGNINDLLKIRPKKPTVIYLKDKLRMGEYLDTKYVYLVHDDPTNMYTHTTTQSLVGRCCGYGKKEHQVLIYCDYDKAYQHYQWIRKNYDIDYIPSNAKYIKHNGETKAICIY